MNAAGYPGQGKAATDAAARHGTARQHSCLQRVWTAVPCTMKRGMSTTAVAAPAVCRVRSVRDTLRATRCSVCVCVCVWRSCAPPAPAVELEAARPPARPAGAAGDCYGRSTRTTMSIHSTMNSNYCSTRYVLPTTLREISTVVGSYYMY